MNSYCCFICYTNHYSLFFLFISFKCNFTVNVRVCEIKEENFLITFLSSPIIMYAFFFSFSPWFFLSLNFINNFKMIAVSVKNGYLSSEMSKMSSHLVNKQLFFFYRFQSHSLVSFVLSNMVVLVFLTVISYH